MAVNELFFERFPDSVLEYQIQVRPYNALKTKNMRNLNPEGTEQRIHVQNPPRPARSLKAACFLLRHRSADHPRRHGDPHFAAHPRDAGGVLPVPGVRLQRPRGGGSRPHRRASRVSQLQQHPQHDAGAQPLGLLRQTDGGFGDPGCRADCGPPSPKMCGIVIGVEVTASVRFLRFHRSKFKSLPKTCPPVRRPTPPSSTPTMIWWIKCSQETESTSLVGPDRRNSLHLLTP